MEDLKGRTLRGGLATFCSQTANFGFRLGSLVVLARLLSPEDFGMVTMVTVITGIYALFTSAGLSAAAWVVVAVSAARQVRIESIGRRSMVAAVPFKQQCG